jgi:hypothetical protein
MRRTGTRRAAMLAFLLALYIPHTALAAKTDVIVLLNGDRVTGEVKSLEFGVLRYSTDSMGTVNIDWEDVISLTTKQTLQVEVDTGTRYFGSLFEPEAPGMINVGRIENGQNVAKSKVIRLTPIDETEKFIGRFEGSVSFGFDADKGSEVATSNIAGDVGYRTRKYFVGLDVLSSITDQPGAETTERNNVSLNYQRFRNNRWFTDWVISREQNDGLGLDARFTFGGGIGRYAIQSNNHQVSMLVGLNATREQTRDNPEATTNAEGKLTFTYRHRALGPDTDMRFSTHLYPLLKDLTSLRGDADLTFSREFIEDLFFDVTLYYTFVNEATATAAKDDYGVNTSLTYKF